MLITATFDDHGLSDKLRGAARELEHPRDLLYAIVACSPRARGIRVGRIR